VTAFRRGALTLPWGEDYTWQSPIGSQQMTTLLLDMFRAGRRHATTPETSRTMFYTMAHAPGNTPTSWRRNLYGCFTRSNLRCVAFMPLVVVTGTGATA
jgi:hypothetical protein